MAATPYLLTASAAATIKEGANVMAVNANSEAEAEAMASAYFDGDSNLRWTAPAALSLGTDPNDWIGWTLRCVVTDPVTPFTVLDVSVTGASGNSFATLIAALVTALNATAINGAAFGTDTLTVAETTDGMGDWSVQFFMTAPNGARVDDLYKSSIVHQGAAGAALQVVLVANGTLPRTVTPTVVGVYS